MSHPPQSLHLTASLPLLDLPRAGHLGPADAMVGGSGLRNSSRAAPRCTALRKLPGSRISSPQSGPIDDPLFGEQSLKMSNVKTFLWIHMLIIHESTRLNVPLDLCLGLRYETGAVVVTALCKVCLGLVCRQAG